VRVADGEAGAVRVSRLDIVRAFIRQKRRDSSRKGEIRPWMKYMEIEIIEEVLERLGPLNCLEWGAGYSTLCFPGFLGTEARWLAVEHDGGWAYRIGNLNERSGVSVRHVAANHTPWSDPQNDGTYSDLTDYVEYPARFAPFDFILVDGRARASCLEKAASLLTDSGVVVLHDAQREHYQPPTVSFEHQVWFRFGDRRAGGRRERALWLGSVGRPLKSVLDVSRHQRIWRLYDAIGSLVKVV
jgi:predicted O-methyltransferase YrrM